MVGNLSEFVKFFVHAGCNDVALSEGCSGFGMHRAAKIVQKLRTITHSASHILQGSHIHSVAKLCDRLCLAETSAKLHDLTRSNLSCCCSGDDSFKVTDVTYHCLETSEFILGICKTLHDLVSCFEFLKIKNRHGKPVAEHSCTHRRRTSVHHLHEGCSFLSCSRSEYLEIAEGESVHPHKIPLVNS